MNQDIYVLVEHIKGQVADISYMMLAQARAVVQETKGQVVALLLGSQVESLSAGLAADCVWYMNDPALADYTWDAYLAALTETIRANPPRIMLIGDTSMGAEVAGGLSARLGLPLVSYCKRLDAAGGEIRCTSQICGGKMLVEGKLPDETTLVMHIPGAFKVADGKSAQPPAVTSLPVPVASAQRTTVRQYVEPGGEDVDITKEPVLIAIGRGVGREDNLDLVRDLADALGAQICATRPVIDQGWLPTTRLVGKSGKQVKPKVYLALGISGAPEHTESITGSEMIVAVNTDPQAPIFNYARYGAEVDLLDLLPVLTEKLQQAR